MPPDQVPDAFVPTGFIPPAELDHPEFRLRRLGPEHNERDRAAWMSSVEHIQATPGFSDQWFSQPIGLDENLADLQRHQQDFRERAGFTYTVLDSEGPAERAEVIGCVYIYPDGDPHVDVEVLSWVRADRAALDPVLATTLLTWLDDCWPWQRERIRHHTRHSEP